MSDLPNSLTCPTVELGFFHSRLDLFFFTSASFVTTSMLSAGSKRPASLALDQADEHDHTVSDGWMRDLPQVVAEALRQADSDGDAQLTLPTLFLRHYATLMAACEAARQPEHLTPVLLAFRAHLVGAQPAQLLELLRARVDGAVLRPALTEMHRAALLALRPSAKGTQNTLWTMVRQVLAHLALSAAPRGAADQRERVRAVFRQLDDDLALALELLGEAPPSSPPRASDAVVHKPKPPTASPKPKAPKPSSAAAAATPTLNASSSATMAMTASRAPPPCKPVDARKRRAVESSSSAYAGQYSVPASPFAPLSGQPGHYSVPASPFGPSSTGAMFGGGGGDSRSPCLEAPAHTEPAADRLSLSSTLSRAQNTLRVDEQDDVVIAVRSAASPVSDSGVNTSPVWSFPATPVFSHGSATTTTINDGGGEPKSGKKKKKGNGRVRATDEEFEDRMPQALVSLAYKQHLCVPGDDTRARCHYAGCAETMSAWSCESLRQGFVEAIYKHSSWRTFMCPAHHRMAENLDAEWFQQPYCAFCLCRDAAQLKHYPVYPPSAVLHLCATCDKLPEAEKQLETIRKRPNQTKCYLRKRAREAAASAQDAVAPMEH